MLAKPKLRKQVQAIVKHAALSKIKVILIINMVYKTNIGMSGDRGIFYPPFGIPALMD